MHHHSHILTWTSMYRWKWQYPEFQPLYSGLFHYPKTREIYSSLNIKYGGLDDQWYIINGFMKTRHIIANEGQLNIYSKVDSVNKGEESTEGELGHMGNEGRGYKVLRFILDGGWKTRFNTPSRLNYILFCFPWTNIWK